MLSTINSRLPSVTLQERVKNFKKTNLRQGSIMHETNFHDGT